MPQLICCLLDAPLQSSTTSLGTIPPLQNVLLWRRRSLPGLAHAFILLSSHFTTGLERLSDLLLTRLLTTLPQVLESPERNRRFFEQYS